MPAITSWNVSYQSSSDAPGVTTLKVSFPINHNATGDWVKHPLDGNTYPTHKAAVDAAFFAGLVQPSEAFEAQRTNDPHHYAKIVAATQRRTAYATRARLAYRRGDIAEARRLLSLTGYEAA